MTLGRTLVLSGRVAPRLVMIADDRIGVPHSNVYDEWMPDDRPFRAVVLIIRYDKDMVITEEAKPEKQTSWIIPLGCLSPLSSSRSSEGRGMPIPDPP